MGLRRQLNEPADDDDHEVPPPRTGHSRCSDPREQLTDDQTREFDSTLAVAARLILALTTHEL